MRGQSLRHSERLFLVLLCAFGLGLRDAPEEQKGPKANDPVASAVHDVQRASTLEDPKAALASTQKYLGCLGLSEPLPSAKLVKVENDRTPFLHNRVTASQLWKITIPNFTLHLPSTPPGFDDTFVRILDVLFDSVSGQLMSVSSRWPEGEREMPAEASGESASEQMRRSGNEVYYDFPAEPPGISLIDAIDAVQRCGGAPLAAKQIIAHYVLWSRMGKWQEPRRVWAITLRGIAPVKPPPDTPPGFMDQFRYIVDAQTGLCLCGSNMPRPEQWNPERRQDKR